MENYLLHIYNEVGPADVDFVLLHLDKFFHSAFDDVRRIKVDFLDLAKQIDSVLIPEILKIFNLIN